MIKFFKYKWAVDGETTAVPDEVDPSGFVSYRQGYGADYSRVYGTDPLAKAPERVKMNSVLQDITGEIQLIQTHGHPDYITPALNGGTAYAYDIGAICRFRDNKNYINTVAGNTSSPDVSGWRLYDDIAATTYAAASKTTPVNADVIPIVDSSASNVLKKLTWANLKATLFASPALTGTPTSTTPSVGDSSTKIATTAFVRQNRGLVLMTPVEVLSVTTEGTHTSTVSSATFGGLTPTFVMYTGVAYGSSFTDFRYWRVSSGSADNYDNLVMGASSDDTDQEGMGSLSAVSTFTLPYQGGQQFTSVRSGGGTVNLKIKAIGYQL